jgi:diguanylate cyclase (GGDEF)-like protein/hemerythrin-like metal-binding protein/PAS domain S-box-containing protein
VKSIDIFPWNDNFNTGITIIDEQHRRLVELLNQLASHLAFQSDLPELNVIFDQLADYTVYHFQTEEKIWHKNLPEDSLESAHKNVHASFIHKVLELKTDINTKPSDEVIEDILSFLTRWLALHILESDRYMAMVTLAIQAGQPIVSAKKKADEQMQGSTKALIDVILSIYQSLSTNALYLMRKISEQTRLENALIESEKKLQLFIKHAPAALAMFDKKMRYIAVSQRWLSDYDITDKYMAGQSHYDLFPEISERWKSVHHRGLNGEVISEECDLFERDDGSIQWIKWEVRPWRDVSDEIGGIIIFSEDITEKQQAEARIKQLAYFDQLTGLPNRGQLTERFNYTLKLAERSGDQFTLMFLDLDHFKNINDTLGHSVGDQILLEVASRLKTILREEDTLSRMGGDEFILLLPGTNEKGAREVATKLINIISKPSQIEQYELTSTVSIGIVIYPNDGQDFETLSRNADTAMYRVKQASRNDYRFFTEEMQAHSARSLQVTNALRHALERNELALHYQPQISMEDGRIIGAEALLRWCHPEMGMIPPDEFIPLAEESGQILQIGEWVLRTAVNQLKHWMDNGLPAMVMAVNLSAVQFRHSNLPKLVTQILNEAKLPAEYLELELTEATTMDDPHVAIMIMDNLHDLGIRMSIDDFGTGYSSLSYLKKFKAYKLKIDQSFVRDIKDDPDDKAIVTAIINLAHSLDMQTIAEGVETSSQLAFLRLQGCDEIQGYYFSKPLPAADFETFAVNLVKCIK